MDKYIKDLIEDLASKMATNDLPYDYRVRCINEYTEKIVKLFAIPDVSGSLPISDNEYEKVINSIYPKDNSKKFRRQ